MADRTVPMPSPLLACRESCNPFWSTALLFVRKQDLAVDHEQQDGGASR